MAGNSNEQPGLSTSEWEVMKVVWTGGPMAMGDIYDRLSEEQDWAYATAKTLVRRMVAKGWLSYRRVGNSFLYRAAMPRKTAVRAAVKEFSGRVLDGLLSPFLAYYTEEKDLSPNDIATLEEIIKRHRKNGGK